MAANGDRPVAPGAVRIPAADATWERLDDQIGWYDRKSGANQRLYKLLKLLEIAIAAALPNGLALRSEVVSLRFCGA